MNKESSESSSTGSAPGRTPLSAALAGTWMLSSREDRTPEGRPLVEPSLGSDPVALLIYDRHGYFAAQFMKRDRSTASEPQASTSAVNNSRVVSGYDAYFGSYTVDDENGTVTQELIGALAAENVGQVLTRAMSVVSDELVIRVDTATATGMPTIRTLRWRRVP